MFAHYVPYHAFLIQPELPFDFFVLQMSMNEWFYGLSESGYAHR
jgi:hypothetical protein